MWKEFEDRRHWYGLMSQTLILCKGGKHRILELCIYIQLLWQCLQWFDKRNGYLTEAGLVGGYG